MVCFVPDLLEASVGKMGLALGGLAVGWEGKGPSRYASILVPGIMAAEPVFGQTRK